MASAREKARVIETRYRTKHNARRRAYDAKYRVTSRDKVLAARAKQAEARRALGKESAVEIYFCGRVADAGGMAPKFKDLGRRGAPDRLAIFDGHPTYYVELKRPKGGKLATWQVRYHADLRAHGQQVWVLNTEAAVDAFMLEILL